MATTSGVCHNDPNFAVICSFLDRYSEILALPNISYSELESWIEDTKRVNPNLIDLHIRMLRRSGKKSCSNVTLDRWEKALVKFCHTYSDVDAWEIERFSYKYCKVATKLKLLKNLLECQFDSNIKFKDRINELLPEDMRVLPIGRDKNGLAYWYMMDKSLNLRIYREDLDDVDSETWELVCRDRDDLAKLIENLEKGGNTKLDKSDLSDTSYKSEPVSDFNEDSRDSVIRSRSCTPIKPSPLTIKAEQTDEEDNDSNTDQKVPSGKLTMRLKIPKVESDSPRKRLKDKFEKEKGQQIKNKKKCKIKGEQDSEEDENSADEGDEDNKESGDHNTDKNAKAPEGHEEKDDEKEDSKHNEVDDKKEDSNYDEVDGLGDAGKDAEIVQIKKKVKLTDLKETTSENDKNSTDANIRVKEESSEIENEGTESDMSRALTKEDNNLNCNNRINTDNSEKKDFKEFKDETKDDENTSVEGSFKKEIKSDTNGAQSSNLDNCHLDIHNDKDSAKDISNKDKTISDNENNLCIEDDGVINKSGNEIVQSVKVNDNQINFSADKDKTDDSNLSSKTNDEKLESPNAKDDKVVKIEEETNHSKNIQVCDSNVDTELDKKSAVDIPSDKAEIKSIKKSENVCKSKEDEPLKSEMQKQSVLDSELSQGSTDADRKNIDPKEKEVGSKKLEPVVDTEVRSQTPEAVVCKPSSSESQNKECPISTVETDSNSKLDSNSKTTEDTQEVVQICDKTTDSSAKYGESESIELVISKAEESLEDSILETKEANTKDNDNKVDKDKNDVRRGNQNVGMALTKSDIESEKREYIEVEDKKTSDSHDGSDKKDESDKKGDDVLRDREVKTCDKISDSISNDQKGDNEQNNKGIEKESKHEQTDSCKTDSQKEDTNSDLNNEETTSKEESINDNEKISEISPEDKIVDEKEETTSLSKEDKNKEVSEKHSEISELSETKQAASPQRKTKVAIRKLTKKAVDKVSDTQEKADKNQKDESSDQDSSSDSSEDDSTSSDSSEDVPLTRMKGLLAHSRLNKGKAVKRQAEDSLDDSPVEPVSKRSKVRGRVTSKSRTKPRAHEADSSESTESSSDSDDVPLSQISTKKKGKPQGKKAPPPRKQSKPQPVKKSSQPVKKKKITSDEDFKSKSVKSKGSKSNTSKPPEDKESDLSEEDTGRRRSARVRNLRSRKKEPSPDFIPSELEDFITDLDSDDDEFVVKSKRRKKKQVVVEEELPKGKNAKRLEAKSKKKSGKQVEVEEPEDETPCCKCLKSNQPEWILLCDKCDSGYHTACLRPPLMIIPDGDWYCPPCEHTMLIEKLQENLTSLDQNLLKSDRLVRRKERLAFVGISLDNIIKEERKEDVEGETESESVSSDSDSDKSSKSSSESESSESASEQRYPRRRTRERKDRRRERKKARAEERQAYIKRTCRSRNPISYKFEEYDELIADAIQEDMSIPKEPKPKKVKPPGISRGKDMSNILGVSDEDEKPAKAAKKRRPRLTELDDTEGEGDDDTDDYQVSLQSSASEVSQESEGVVESGSDFSDEMYNRRRHRGRGTRRSRRRRRGCSRYNDFVVESDYDSEEEDTGRRSTRKSARKHVNYREFNSDESEVKADEDESFHTSDLSSDDGKRKKASRKSKSKSEKNKRDKKRKHVDSSEDWTEESDSDSRPSSKKKPARKNKKDSDEEESSSEDSESDNRPKGKAAKRGKVKDDTESEEGSGEDDGNDLKVTGKKKKAHVIESGSDSESDKQTDEENKDEKIKAVEKGKNELEKGNSKEIDRTDEEGSETEVSEGEWEEVDINSGSDKGGKMKSPKRKASPARGGTTPKKGTSSPQKDMKSPVKRDASPKKGGSSPKKGSASPKKAMMSPTQTIEQIAEQVFKESDNHSDEANMEEADSALQKPKQSVKNVRKRKSTDTAESVTKPPEIKGPAEHGTVPFGLNEHVAKEMDKVDVTDMISGEPVSKQLDAADTGQSVMGQNVLQEENVHRINIQQDISPNKEGQDLKLESSPDAIPLKKKRTRRTKAQMEEFRKIEEEYIQQMIVQGTPEDIARKRRQNKKARTQSIEELQAEMNAARGNVTATGRDFLLEEALPATGSMTVENARRPSIDANVSGVSDGQIGIAKTIESKEVAPVNEDLKASSNVNIECEGQEVTVKDEFKSSETDIDRDTIKPKGDSGSESIKTEPEKSSDAKVPDERKDDSPLSARRDYNNAPVGIVKPEVRQGVIVENRQVMDSMRGPMGPGGRPLAASSNVSPLQGMKDMTMGKLPEQGGFSSPNMPPGYQSRGNTEGFRQPNYPGYPAQQGPYGPSQQQPYQQGMPHRPYPYNDPQSPVSPTSRPPPGQYMSPNMPPGPQGYYQGSYRSSMGPGMEGPQSPPAGYGGYGPMGPSNNPNYPQQGPFGQGFHSPTGSYQGQMQSPGPYPEPQSPMQGPHQGPSAQMNYPPNMPSGYPHVPQPHHPSHSMQYPQNAPPMSSNQPIRPQPHPASRSGPSQSESPTVRPPMVGVPPRSRRGFMMDNILKPTSSGGREEETGDEINDIVNYVANDEYFKEH